MLRSKKFVAVLVGSVLLVLGTVGIAYSWLAPTASGQAACDSTAGNYDIAWHVVNNENDSHGWPARVFTAAVSPPATDPGLVGSVLANNGGSVTKHSSVPGNYVGDINLTVMVVWYNNDNPLGGVADKRTSTAKVTLGGSCSAPTTTTTTVATQDISAKALCDHQIDASEWHFVITQTTTAQAPTSIHVTWTGGVSEDVPLEKVTGGVAHYSTADHLNLQVISATAEISGVWNGQFNLSHGPGCVAPPSSTTSSTSTTVATSTSTSTVPTSTTTSTVPASTTTSTTVPSTTTTTRPSSSTSTVVTSTTSTTAPVVTTITSTTTAPTTTTRPSTSVPSSPTSTTEVNDTTTTTNTTLVPPVSVTASVPPAPTTSTVVPPTTPPSPTPTASISATPTPTTLVVTGSSSTLPLLVIGGLAIAAGLCFLLSARKMR